MSGELVSSIDSASLMSSTWKNVDSRPRKNVNWRDRDRLIALTNGSPKVSLSFRARQASSKYPLVRSSRETG